MRARELADCASVAFVGSYEDANPLLSFLWDYGDGSQSSEPVIVYRYGAPGRYDALAGSETRHAGGPWQ